MPAVSIIIPVYNAEDRIEKCIQSVQRQTLKEIEIIIVNDGSTDQSQKIIEKIAKTDSRIKFSEYPNGGAAFARNRGLLFASGEYITFVDADDWIEPGMYKELMEVLIKDSSDLAVCAIQKESNQASQQVLPITNHLILRERLLEKCILMEFDYSLCNKMYKRDTLLKNNISFAEDLRISQDVLFNFYVFACISTVSIIPKAFYHYVAKEGSLMSSPQDKRIASFNYIITAFKNYCSENNKPEAWQIFTRYIGPGYQKYLFNLVLKSDYTKPMGFREYYKHVLTHLKLMNPLLIEAPIDQENRYQKFRKGLLQQRRFKIFSLLTAIRHKTFKY